VLELSSGLGADRGCVFAVSATGNITCSAAVRPRDQSAKFDGITGDGCVPGDRRPA
jgi:hypothetical protein